MTDQTRETLTDVLERAMSMDDDVPIWAYNYRKTGAVAAALRDVLTPRTCGTCRHAVSSGAWLACTNRNSFGWQRHLGANDGCLKGWQAREGEGGGR